MSAARRPQRGAYESFLLQHVSQVTALESSLRSMTYILPGRFKDAELAGEQRDVVTASGRRPGGQ